MKNKTSSFILHFPLHPHTLFLVRQEETSNKMVKFLTLPNHLKDIPLWKQTKPLNKKKKKIIHPTSTDEFF